MINAGRVLIIPKGEWTNLESYEMLDLVTRGDIAYIARQASVGVDPATDTQLTYWQPFGTAAKIATTTTPGLVMPDGTTVTIDATGLISANIGISDIKNVAITSISNGQILQYNSSTQKWENKSLGSAASRNATSSITSGSTDLIESGAVSSLKQTLTEQVSTKAEQSLLAPIQTTLVASKPYTIGEQFVYQGLLYKATAAISQGGTITIDGNCSLSDDVTTQIDKISKTETVTLSNLSGYYNSFSGIKRNKIVNFSVSTKDSLPASTWITIGQMDVAPEIGQTFVGLIATGAGNTAIINITGSGGMQIFASVSGAFNASGSFICK